jgi:2-polyprenyl-3-methyl-5-hydroxy-6-metoxy-1,4-benzoquinol methylase
MFSQRFIQPELLDSAEPEEARANLQDLVRINRRFGGHSTIRKTLARVAASKQAFSLLDIGAASGDSARVIQKAYPLAKITSLDYSVVNCEEAPMPKVIADAFQPPFAPNSFDFVFCSSFLHHFSNEQVTEFLRRAYEIARKALIVCDLERHVLPYLFLPATKFLFGWKRLTLHDGPISVRASFRASELRTLSEKAGITGVEIAVYRPAFRIAMIARKHSAKSGG